MKIKNKFYIAADRVMQPGDTWAKPTLEAAIDHARLLLEREPHNDVKYIVKVIKVVRRKSMPVQVENVV